MKDIMIDNLEKVVNKNSKIKYISATETSYDYFRVECTIDDVNYRLLETRHSRCSDMVFTDTSHSKGVAKSIIKKILELGGKKEDVNWYYTYNHNPQCWEEDIGEFDGYYNDGLDHIEELNYME